MRLAQVDGGAQHFVVGDEEWHLEEEGQTASYRVHALALVEVGDFLVHLLLTRIAHAVLLILFLDGLHLRLHSLHLERGPHLVIAEGY